MATLALDVNRTHTTTPHGRVMRDFMWQSLNTALMSIIEIVLIWSKFIGQTSGFYLVVVLTSLSLLAFVINFTARKNSGGALSDPNGIQPFSFRLGRTIVNVDMNLTAFLAALITPAALVCIFRY